MDIKKLYLDWLDSQIKLNQINDKTYELVFQFLDLEDEYLCIYVTKEKNGYSVCSDFCGFEKQYLSCSCTDEIDIPCCIQGIINSVLRGAIK